MEEQARALHLPLLTVPVPFPCPNEVYERAMGEAVHRLHEEGVTRIVFGDLFLEDVRSSREERLKGSGRRARLSFVGAFDPGPRGTR